jgi:hypothetical protein
MGIVILKFKNWGAQKRETFQEYINEMLTSPSSQICRGRVKKSQGPERMAVLKTNNGCLPKVL